MTVTASKWTPWLPKSILVLRGYDGVTFRQDLIAGVTVGLVALPLAMAFAIASGLTPQAGIYCAIVTGFLISALGGSRVQIGGPTGAFVVVISGIVAEHGVPGLFMCTMMAGVMLVILGLTGPGTAVRFIPRPVVIGFTNGIAVLIASTQIRDFLGLRMAENPGEFIGRLAAIGRHLDTITPAALGLAVTTIVLVLATNRFVKGIPGTVVGLVAGTGVAWVAQLPVETVASRFGALPSGLPAFDVPAFRPSLMLTLLSPALTVCILGAIESLMSAVVADRMTGDRHNPNVELIGQGIANIVSPLFGGLPATGAIARTATNVRSGARTPVAGMIHALTLLAALLFGGGLAGHVPMAVLAAILFVVAANMGEWHEIPLLLRQTKTDISVWLVTFALTVFADLTVAVEVGMILAALLYIRRVSSTTTVDQVTARVPGRGPCAHPAGQAHSRLRDDSPYPRPVPLRHDRQAGERARPDRRADADRGLPPAQHDGDRRHRVARARGHDAAAAVVGPDGGLLRRARTAQGRHGADWLHRVGGRRECVRQRRGRARPGAVDSRSPSSLPCPRCI